jgi:predicted ArsR family transcriptional regulator
VGMYKKMDRVTVAEAATRLGVKEQAIRKRLQRGTLVSDKDDDGRVYVYIDTEEESAGTSNGTDNDTGINTLVQSLQDQIGYLRQEAEDWKEEARRKDAIIMTMAQRLPELEPAREASPETRDGHEAASKARGTGEAHPAPQEPEQRRSWLYRFFFGFDG